MTYEVVGMRKHKLYGANAPKSNFKPVGGRDISDLRTKCLRGKCSLPTRRTKSTDKYGIEWVKEELLYAPLNPSRWSDGAIMEVGYGIVMEAAE